MNKLILNIFLGFLILAIVVFLGFYLYVFNAGFSIRHSDWGEFGSYSAGTLGICLTAISVIFVYLTFREQRKQRFENDFFLYVANYHNLLNLINENWLHKIEPEYLKGREIFGRTFERICINNLEKSFKETFNLHINVYRHYCNYIISFVGKVYNNRELGEKEKSDYLHRFFSMLSMYELIFLAYYVVFILENEYKNEIEKIMKLELNQFSEIDEALNIPHYKKIVAIINEYNERC